MFLDSISSLEAGGKAITGITIMICFIKLTRKVCVRPPVKIVLSGDTQQTFCGGTVLFDPNNNLSATGYLTQDLADLALGSGHADLIKCQ